MSKVSSPSASILPVAGKQETKLAIQKTLAVIDSLSKEVGDHSSYIKKKRMIENKKKSLHVTNNLYKLSLDRRNFKIIGDDRRIELLAKRQKEAVDMHNGIATNCEDNESSSSHEDGEASSPVLLASSIKVKNAILPINLPEVKRLPPFRSWIFLDRNQKMTEDQSVVGKRRIYYDQNSGEALICSESEEEEEAIDDEDSKKEFGESEDYILRMTIKNVGLSDTTLDLLAQCLRRKSCEIKERYEDLVKGEEASFHERNGNAGGFVKSHIDKDLDAALDSFDHLFCRRCFVFDCKLHGCSQDLVFPSEKQSSWSCLDTEKNPCGLNCHKLVLDAEINNKLSHAQADFEENASPASSITASHMHKMKKSVSCHKERTSSPEIKPVTDVTSGLKGPTAAECRNDKRISKTVADNVIVLKRKRQKKTDASDSDHFAGGIVNLMNLGINSHQEDVDISTSSKVKYASSRKSTKKESPVLESGKSLLGMVSSDASNESVTNQPVTCSNTLKKEEFIDENRYTQELIDNKGWKPLEKALYEKGIQIYGRNSCLIARNLLSGLRSCSEVFRYMHLAENKLFSQSGDGLDLAGSGSKADSNATVGTGARRRSKFLGRKGRVRRSKYTSKSAGYQSRRKRISQRKDQPCIQYNPCGCQSFCGKECPCLVNGTCCEKYCGCPKSCKNRFRGCHCAKSQCRSRQCPCFAADRECDPDLCRNCWIGCGDGSLGVPSQRGDNYECRNMKLLLKQQQRVLLGRSDVFGWGAFLKNSVGKHEYLGEYTGEVISHHEADKRGKIYDRENSSFLFNLNDQFVLDACRKGNKLKFANHSPNPNCYAKVMLVAGDHRVGIFAKERIRAGEELFYDYHYEPGTAPDWAKKRGTTSGAAPSNGRAKKHALIE